MILSARFWSSVGQTLLLDVHQVRVSDVYPTGEVLLIMDNAIRMRWRDQHIGGTSKPQYLLPGSVYQVSFEVGFTSYLFAPGHAIRLSVSSSNFPRFDINLNNGVLLAERQAYDPVFVASQKIFHCSLYPSFISLPKVYKEDLPQLRTTVIGG